MRYPCSIYGLGVLANRIIPTVPPSPVPSVDLVISFETLPGWLNQIDDTHVEVSYIADYNDEAGEPVLRVFSIAGGKYYRFCYSDQTEFVVDHRGTRIWARWSEPLTIEDTTTYLLGPIMGFVLLLRGNVSLHASAIAIGNHAIALVGSAGAGKSTTAAAFSNRGFSVLAEDVLTLDDRENRFLVRPAYPCIRLWPASVRALYGTEDHLPKLTPNWDKCYLDLTARPEQFQHEPLPLAAIYELGERSEEPHAPFVEPLDQATGLISLIANTYSTKLIDKQMRAVQFDLLSRVLSKVPIKRLRPHEDPTRIAELLDTILRDFESLGIGERVNRTKNPQRALGAAASHLSVAELETS